MNSVSSQSSDREYELSHIVLNLSSYKEDVRTYEELENFFKVGFDSPSAEKNEVAIANCFHYLRCLILNQFKNPAPEAIREGIANAFDAHQRAGKEEVPVVVKINKERISIIDQGTGIQDISLFLVPSKTLNPRAIFSLEEGDKKICARFGQGVFSLFYYLAYHWKEKQKASFINNGNGIKEARVPYKDGEIPHEAIFQKEKGEKLSEPKCLPVPHWGYKKIIVSTKNELGSFKLEFFEREGSIFLRSHPDSRKKVGTKIKIISPLLQTEEKIIGQLKNLLQFVHAPVLLLNGAPTYDPTLERLCFEGIDIVYTPEFTDKGGHLFLCEQGRTIQELPLNKGILIPKKIALSFASLPLSHERGTIDWKDPKTLNTLFLGIRGIIRSNLPPQMITTLLNSLTILFREEKIDDTFNMIDFIDKLARFYLDKGLHILPEHKKVRKLEIASAVYFHLDYLKSLYCKTLLSTGNIEVFPVETNNILISSIKKNGKYWIFVNKNLFGEENPFQLFNSLLTRRWVKATHKIFLPNLNSNRKIVSNPLQNSSIPVLEDDSTPIIYDQALDYVNNILPDWEDIPLLQQSIHQLLKKCFKEDDKIPRGYFLFLIDFLFKQNFEKVQRLVENEVFVKWFCWFVKKIYLTQDYFKNVNYINFPILPIQTFAHIVSFTFDFLSGIEDSQKTHEFLYYLYNYQRELKIDSISKLEQAFEDYKKIDDLLGSVNCKASAFVNPFILKFIQFKEKSPEKNSFDFDLARKYLDLFPESCRNTASLLLFDIQNLNEIMTWSQEELICCFTKLLKVTYANDHLGHSYASIVFRNDHRLDGVGQKYSNSQFQYLRKLIQFASKTDNFAFASEIYGYILLRNLVTEDLNKYWDHFFAFCEEAAKDANLNSIGKKLSSIFKSSQTISWNWIMWNQQIHFQCLAVLGINPESLQQNQLMEVINQVKNDKRSEFLQKDRLPGGYSFEEMALQSYRVDKIIKHYKHGGEEVKAKMTVLFMNEFEKLGFLTEETRPFIYALYLPNTSANFMQQPLQLPSLSGSKISLHEDPDVLESLRSPELAKRRIQGAISQTLTRLYWMAEFIKNSKEAGATKIEFKFYYQKEDAILTVIIRDNGKGMNREEMNAFKTPGITTKRKEAEDANFGQGIFTSLAKNEFSSMIVQTNKDGLSNLFKIEKREEELEIQMDDEKETSQSNGTEIILQKKLASSPLNASIYLNSNLIKTCRYLQDVEILLNGRLIAKPEKPFIISRTFVDQQGKTQEMSLQFLEKEASGFFVKGIKMGPISENYFCLVPKFLRDFYQRKKVSFALFLPSVEQVMGRSVIQNDPAIEFAIQHLLLQGALVYLVEEWKKGKRLNCFISQDIWDITRSKSYQHTKLTKLLYEFIFESSEMVSGPIVRDEEAKNNEEILEGVKAFLSHLPVEKLPDIGIEGVLQQLSYQMNSSNLEWHKQHIILTVLANVPLYSNGPSISMLYDLIKECLSNEEIGSFATLSSNEKEIQLEKIDRLFDALSERYPLIKRILTKFKSALRSSLSRCEGQAATQIDTTPSEVLAIFFKQLSLKIFNKTISVQFYTKADGILAHTNGSEKNPTIYINTIQSKILSFEQLAVDYAKGVSPELLTRQYAEIVAYWIEIFAHEFAHTQEGSNCAATHDRKFNKKMAENIEKLFEHPQRQSIFKMLFDILDEKKNESKEKEIKGKKRKLKEIRE